MAIFSGFWTTEATGPVGHQVAEYNQTQLGQAMEIVAACLGREGIAGSVEAAFAATAPSDNTVRVGRGVAMVDGRWVENDALEDINIPSASGSGNTRIDRIVLRADHNNYQVTLHRIAGVDAASPAPPVISENRGTLFDLRCYRALVDTVGNVSLTDERELAQIAAVDVPGNLISNDKIRLASATSVMGRSLNSSGNVADILAGGNDTLLRRVFDTLGFGQLTLGMIPDTLITTAKLAVNAVTNVQFRQSVGASIVGRSANSTGNVADIQAAANDTLLRRVSNALSFGQLTLGMIPDALITAVKLAADARTTVKIDEVVLGSSAATITFSSIPATYTHLRIVAQARGTVAATTAFVRARFNGDTGSNYSFLRATLLHTDTLGTTEGLSATSAEVAAIAGANASAGSTGIFTLEIPNYRRATFQKHAYAGAGAHSSVLAVDSAIIRWHNTAAINQITFLLNSGSFAAGTVVTLYGIL
jgi:hypothetical protein